MTISLTLKPLLSRNVLLAYELLCSFKGLLYPLQTMPEYIDFISSQEAILLLSKLLGIATICGWLIIEERVASTLANLLLLLIEVSLPGRYYYSHFTDEDRETQRSEVICPRSHSRIQDLHPGVSLQTFETFFRTIHCCKYISEYLMDKKSGFHPLPLL